MAFISIYDSTPTDQVQLSAQLKDTDHYPVYIEGSINESNLQLETEVISVFVSSQVTRSIIEKLPRRKLIACRSTGYNNVDLAAAAEHGVSVVNVPTYGERTVAEYTFALLLSLTRKLRQAVDSLSDIEFDQKNLMGLDLAEKTIGIIGMGRIGQHVGQTAMAFGMRIIAYDPFPNEERAKELHFAYVSLDELAANSDVISLHSPYTGDNRHIVDEAFLSKVKPSAVLINTARGELVDTQAVIAALHEKRLGGAGFDVLEGEQLLKVDEELLLLRRDTVPADLLADGLEIDVLKKFPNVIVTPHNAFNTIEAIGRINQTTADNMIQFWYGNIPNKVQPPPPKPGKLVITRHGESEWNALGKWTGSRDVHLSEKGFHEAALLGIALKDITLDYAFTSQQIRAFETMEGILDSAQQFDVPYERTSSINERDYGDYTGLNKWEVQEKLGDDVFQHLRRDWDYSVPNGETLKMVYERAVPFYMQNILPKLLEGKNVLVVSHGNAIRALVKYIENISDEDIANLEMPFGNIVIYEVDTEGHMTKKGERLINTVPPPA